MRHLRSEDLVLKERHHRLNRGNYLLCVLILTAALTLLGIAAISAFCLLLIPPIPHGAAFDSQFTVSDSYFYSDQPAKTTAYQGGCLAAPFLLALSFWAARRWTNDWSSRTINRVVWCGIIFYLLLMVSCAWPIIYCPDPPFGIFPPSWILLPIGFSHPWLAPARVLFLLAAVGIEIFFLVSHAHRRNANWALILLLAIWVALSPGRFYPPSEINDEPRYIYHLNAVLDALSQSVNGHHLLVDFPHIYGGYIEMLAPIIRLFPREVETLIAALAVPNILGMFCLLFTAWLIIRRPAVLLMSGLTLLSINCVASNEDVVYGYLTARLFFPPVGLLAATLYFRRPAQSRYALTTVVVTLATIWNLDTGLVLWASWLGTLLATATATRDLPGGMRHLLVQTLALGAVWIGFFFYLRVASGQWPDGGMLFYFQKLVVNEGYFCLPLLFPDMWVFILMIYLMGLVLVLSNYISGQVRWLTPVTLMISLLGIGIFSYFMGRSAPSNLMGVAYPAVLLAGVFCSEGEVLMRRAKLPANTRFLLLPSRIALFWWGFLLVAALYDLLAISGRIVRDWNNTALTPLRANVAFVTAQVRPHEDDVYFLSNHSGIYYYLSDTVRPIKSPGTVELLRSRDMDVLLDAIRKRRIRKLFVEQNFYAITMYRPDIYDEVRSTIDQNYRPSQVAPTEKLILYLPK